MEAIFFAMVAHVGWGTSDIFGAIASRKIGGYSATFWSYVVRVPFLALYIPFDLANLSALNLNNFLVSALLSIIMLVGTAFFFDAFRSSNASLVGTIGSAFVVPTVILSVIFFNETLDFRQLFAIGVIVVGLVATSLDFKSLRERGTMMNRGVALALLAMICWGIYFALIRIPVEEIGWFLPSYIGFLCAPFVLVLMKIQKVKLEMPTANQAFPSFLAMLLLGTAANFGYNLGISSGFTSIVAPIAGAYPVLFVLLSALMFKEPLEKAQIVGMVISLAGIVTLSALA